MKRINIFLTATLSIAMVFIFSCAGNNGEDGTKCITEPQANAEGTYDVLCDGEKVGELSSSKIECFVETQTDGRMYIICNDEKLVEIRNGVDGKQGEEGEQGEQGKQGEQGEPGIGCDTEDDGPYLIVKCGEEEKSRIPKAMCGASAYDPAEMTCDKNILSFSFIDSRDNSKYKAVIIGTQTWMAENLNYSGTSASKLGLCYAEGYTGISSDSIAKNCAKYGRLYNWETASTACPSGWHLPKNTEWATLFDFVGDYNGLKLKALSGWEDYIEYTQSSIYINGSNYYFYYQFPTSGNGTDDYNFSVLPGGGCSNETYCFSIGNDGFFWTSTESNPGYSVTRYFANNNQQDITYSYYQTNLHSVRCVKDL